MLSGQLNTSNPTPAPTGLKPAEPIGKEAPRVCCDSDLCNDKHSAKSAKEEINAAITTIILANSTESNMSIANIATATIGQPIDDDRVRRLRPASGAPSLPVGWQHASTGRPADPPEVRAQKKLDAREKRDARRPKKEKRIIQVTPELCQGLDFQRETQEDMSKWLDVAGKKACATKRKNESVSDETIATECCRSLYDYKNGKLILNLQRAFVNVPRYSYGLPLSVHLVPASCRQVAIAGSSGAAGTGNTRAGRQGGRQQQI